MWINGTVNINGIYSITATKTSGGVYTLECQAPGITGGGSFGLDLATFASQAATQAALDAFLKTVGAPWLAIGALSGVGPSQNPWVLAVNLANVLQMSDGGSGIVFNGTWSSAGYAPWANGTAALAGLLAIAGSIAMP